MEKYHSAVSEQAPEQPDLGEVFGDQELVLFGVKGTVSELKAMCPIADDPTRMTPEAENKFIVMAINEAGGEVPRQYEAYFKQVLERQGVEPKYIVTEAQPGVAKQKAMSEVNQQAVAAPNAARVVQPTAEVSIARPAAAIAAETSSGPPSVPVAAIVAQLRAQADETLPPQLVVGAEVAPAELAEPVHGAAANELVGPAKPAPPARPAVSSIPRPRRTPDLTWAPIEWEPTPPVNREVLAQSADILTLTDDTTSDHVFHETPPEVAGPSHLPERLQFIVEQPRVTFAELLAANYPAPVNAAESMPQESAEQPPITEDILSYAHRLFEADPEQEQLVVRLVSEAQQIAELLVTNPETSPVPTTAALEIRLQVVCERILATLDIASEATDVERLVHALLHDAVRKQFPLLEETPLYVDDGMHEAALASWFNGVMQQLDFPALLAPFVGRLALHPHVYA